MAKDQKVYMPLVIGDWLKGTRGMKAEVRGVYIGLLLYQWDNGFIPSDMEELALIEPEVGKVWVTLQHKYVPLAPGKLRNIKCDEVKAFWAKQGSNGSKGGRPKTNNPDDNPNHNPKANPNHNHHIALALDNDLVSDTDQEKGVQGKEERFLQTWSTAFDELTKERFAMNFRDLDIDAELKLFALKCQNDHSYQFRDPAGLRNAFQYQLKQSKPGKTGSPRKLAFKL